MPDVQVRISTTGAEQAVQAFNQTAQASQRFAQTTSSTVSQARVATMGFNIALLETARVARLAGPAGKEFATSLESAATVGFAARGAIGAYRSVVDGLPLILRAATAATEGFQIAMTALLGPWGLLAIAITAATVALTIYLARQQQTNGVTQDAIRLHQSLAHAVTVTLTEQERLALALRGASRYWAEQAERIHALREQFVELKANEDAATAAAEKLKAAQKDVADTAERFQKIPNYFREIGAAATDIERPVSTLSKTQSDAFDKMEADLKKMADDIQAMADAYGDFVPSTQQASNAVKNLQIQFEDGLKSMLTVTAQGTDLFSQLWTAAINQVIAKLLEMQALKQAVGWLSGFFGGILSIFGLQHGGSFIATRPTPLMVGESAERVTVSPLAGAPATGGGGGMTVNFNAPQFWDEITYANFIKKVGRDLTSGPVSRVG